MNSKSGSLIPALTIALALTALLSACNKGVNHPPVPPPEMTVNIYPVNGIYEADSGRAYYIGGSVVGRAGDTLVQKNVYLSVDPADMGRMTPGFPEYVITDPSQSNGFDVPTIFVGLKSGTVAIWAKVYNDQSALVSSDSFHVWVRPSVNG